MNADGLVGKISPISGLFFFVRRTLIEGVVNRAKGNHLPVFSFGALDDLVRFLWRMDDGDENRGDRRR
jgi:hypothetical protein